MSPKKSRKSALASSGSIVLVFSICLGLWLWQPEHIKNLLGFAKNNALTQTLIAAPQLPDEHLSVIEENQKVGSISQLKQRQFDIHGQPSSQIESKHIDLHENKVQVLHEPTVTLFNAENHWQVTADYGYFEGQTQSSNFVGNVVLKAKNQSHLPTLQSPELKINHDAQMASSQAGVTLSQENAKTSAQNLNIDLNTSMIKLDTRVTSKILPPSKQILPQPANTDTTK